MCWVSENHLKGSGVWECVNGNDKQLWDGKQGLRKKG